MESIINTLRKIIFFLNRHKFLLLMMLILILVREGMVIFDMWQQEEGGDLLESLITGNFAFDILDGTFRGWDTYYYVRRGSLGNNLIASIFAMPLYIFFGNSLFILHQIQIISSLLILLLMYIYCEKYFGSRIAKIASFLFICFPISIQSYLIYAHYLNFDSCLYSLISFLIFIKLIQEKQIKKKYLFAGILGFGSGIGYFLHEVYFLTTSCVLLFWFIKDRIFFRKKELFIFIICLIIGMLPSILSGVHWHIDFFTSLLSFEYNYSHDPGIITNSYWLTLDRMATVFWPIKNLLIFVPINQLITLIGIIVLIITAFLMKTQRKFNLPFALIFFYNAFSLSLALIFKLTPLYYFHSMLVPTIILISIFIYNFQSKWFNQIYLKIGFYIVLFFIGSVNIYTITKQFDIKGAVPRFKKQISINGCCFFWPENYIPPDGLKTDLGMKIEAMTIEAEFTHDEFDKTTPYKTIYISPCATAFYPLLSPESYILYCKDVSFTGIEKLANEISLNVPEDAKPFAYVGLAVFYVNDNWFKDLLKDFKNGVIERNIPKEFHSYFYMELARKAYNYYRGNQEKIDKILRLFNDEKRRWMQEAMLNLR